jgi:hypothetical protein
MGAIMGWLNEPDAQALVVLDGIQIQLGITGNLLEVGVYRGKTLALLALLAREDEIVIGVDGFTLGKASREASAEALEFATGDSHAAMLIKLDTATESCSHVVRLAEPCRMLHIDAGHAYANVKQDLDTFELCVHDAGIVAIDDYFQRDDPGVCVATNDFCARSGFAPFMSSFNKLFLCMPGMMWGYITRLLSTAEYADTSRVDLVRGLPLLVTNTKKVMSQQECYDVLKRCVNP